MKEIWEDKGRWHAKYKHCYAITATQTQAENKVRQWKGLDYTTYTPAPKPVAPMHDEVVYEKEKIAGAIVEESILDADTDDDGVITREEIANWADKHG